MSVGQEEVLQLIRYKFHDQIGQRLPLWIAFRREEKQKVQPRRARTDRLSCESL